MHLPVSADHLPVFDVQFEVISRVDGAFAQIIGNFLKEKGIGFEIGINLLRPEQDVHQHIFSGI